MSQLSARSEIFLGEMGIGMQWKLRNPAPAAFVEEAPPAEEQASAAVALMPGATAPVSVAPAVPPVQAPIAAPAPHVPMSAAPSAQQAQPAPAAWAEPEAPQSVAPHAAQPPMPAAARPAGQPADVAPAVRPAESIDDAPVAAAGDAPYVADAGGAGEDTAWFDDVPAAPPLVRASAPRTAPAVRGPVSEEAIADMDWDELQAAVSSCTRCGLCATRRQAVPGRGAPKASWMAIAAAPSADDEESGRTISGEAGQLLDNMLKAVALSTESNAYITTLVKCRPQTEDGADRLPSADEVMACRPFLEREMALSGATMSLTLGQLAAKGLIGVAARGKVHHYGTLPVVATYHPDDLLRKPQDKAKAWADLCLAREARD